MRNQKYLFDLTGYLILRELLSQEEVAALNEGIDHHIDQLTPLSESNTSRVRGQRNRDRMLSDVAEWFPNSEPVSGRCARSQICKIVSGSNEVSLAVETRIFPTRRGRT